MEPVRPKNNRTIIWSSVAALTLVAFAIISYSKINFSDQIKGFEDATNNFIVQKFHSDAGVPPPLRGLFGEPREPLTDAGVLTWTNKNREDASLKDLTQNDTLSEMAKQKLDDLFAKQYFEHESPTGVGPGDLADKAGYDYIVIGENLALGNFDGDKALVDAWMASPGHRANILNVRYREIGIAVGQGTFEGKTTWIAVQEFGLSITACSQPSHTAKTSIDQTQKSVDTLEASLGTQKTAIDSAEIKYGADYSAEVNEYNDSVHQYNALVVTLKAKISAYNKQVATFNACAEAISATSTPVKTLKSF